MGLGDRAAHSSNSRAVLRKISASMTAAVAPESAAQAMMLVMDAFRSLCDGAGCPVMLR